MEEKLLIELANKDKEISRLREGIIGFVFDSSTLGKLNEAHREKILRGEAVL